MPGVISKISSKEYAYRCLTFQTRKGGEKKAHNSSCIKDNIKKKFLMKHLEKKIGDYLYDTEVGETCLSIISRIKTILLNPIQTIKHVRKKSHK